MDCYFFANCRLSALLADPDGRLWSFEFPIKLLTLFELLFGSSIKFLKNLWWSYIFSDILLYFFWSFMSWWFELGPCKLLTPLREPADASIAWLFPISFTSLILWAVEPDAENYLISPWSSSPMSGSPDVFFLTDNFMVYERFPLLPSRYYCCWLNAFLPYEGG